MVGRLFRCVRGMWWLLLQRERDKFDGDVRSLGIGAQTPAELTVSPAKGGMSYLCLVLG